MLLSQKLQTAFDYLMITIGSFIAAIGIGLFIVPANVVPGGVTGISMTINFIFKDISIGTWIFILNVPLFIWGVKELGNSFGIRTFYGFATNSIFIDLLRGDIPFYSVFSDNVPDIGLIKFQDTAPIQYLLANDFFFFILVGSLIMGFGLGLVFKFKGTTAGTEIICAIAKKRLGISPGLSMIITDFFIIFAATILLIVQNTTDKPAIVLMFYAFMSLYISSILLDRVVYGFDYARNLFIFSSKTQEISDFIINKLDRGVTAFRGRGMYTNVERDVLMTVVQPNDARELTPYIKKLDPNAFIVLSDVHEVLGEGFRSREEVDIKFLDNIRQKEAKEAAAKAAQVAIRAEIDAKTAEDQAAKAREFADGDGTASAQADAVQAEHDAKAARKAANDARAHAVELEMASSIENCLQLDDIDPNMK